MANETPRTLKAHVSIHVTSLARSIAFYRQMFGTEPSKVRAAYAKFDLADPPLNFSLNELPFREGGSLSHFGIQVASTEDVLAMRERWTLAGLGPRDEMHTECCCALQDKTWLRDPDGNEWEVFAVLRDNLPERQLREAACCAPTCCQTAAK
jgi:catechol 2,3-dioxygenase-like lactoylglutathione lyase family enzyme